VTILTDRPDSTAGAGTGWTVAGGAADADDAVKDDSDTTYVDGPANANDTVKGIRLGMPNTAVPATAKVRAVRLRFRAKDDSTWPWDSLLQARPLLAGLVGAGVASAWGNTAITDYTGGWMTTKPAGGPWTQADLDAMEVLLTTYTDNFGGAGGRIYSVHRDIDYNESPTVSVTASAPAGVSRPSFTWVMSDTEGDPQQEWHAKLFTSAQYGAGGFDPATSAATWDSGPILESGTRSGVSPVDLANGTQARVYMRVRQADVSGQPSYSPWTASNTVTINVTPPAAPGLAILVDNTTGSIRLTVTKNNAEANTTVTIQYADNGELPWKNHPALTGLAMSGGSGSTLVVRDYEAPIGVTRYYQAAVTVAGALSSGWSGSVLGAHTSSRTWWKDPLEPIYNMKLDTVELDLEYEEPQGVSAPLGMTTYNVQSDVVRQPKARAKIRTTSEVEYVNALAMLNRGRAILVQDVFSRQWYFRVGRTRQVTRVRAAAPSGSPWPVRHFHELTFDLIPVPRPSS
jgi:hypothetical protein